MIIKLQVLQHPLKPFADVAQSVERRLGKTKKWRFAGAKNN